jgi:PIN domain nuclease of toxin-antitoxin system
LRARAGLAAALPLIHRDPFDRMIIAQASNRQLTIITGDGVLARYEVDVILV